MRNRTKFLVAGLLVTVAGLFVYDAQAGNLASTPSTEYFYVYLSGGQYFKYTGSAEEPTILIDDVTFVGTADVPCPGELHCSFLDITGQVGDLGLDIELESGFGPSMTQGAAPGGTATMFTTSEAHATQHTDFYSFARTWFNGMGLIDSGEPGGGFASINIDTWGSYGFAATAVRERVDTSMFKEQWVAWRAGEGGGTNVGGAGGAGVGVGTGVGLAGWETVVTQSRHYQTPYIVQGTRVYLARPIGNGPGGNAHIKGRIILNPAEAPTVNTDFTVYSE
jgi:hypothetical protein